MKVLDLFSGIGGFSLGLERAGMTTAAFCEFDEKCRKVLAKHWPDVPQYTDVRTLTGEQLEKDGITDIGLICGGYPCQPFSFAGKRQGTADDRHLWPEFARLIGEIRPDWVIAENVAGHIDMGLDSVLADLASLGYTAEPYVIPAVAVGAFHRRDRVWIVADTRHAGVHQSGQYADASQESEQSRGVQWDGISRRQQTQIVADALCEGSQGWPEVGDTEGCGAGRNEQSTGCHQRSSPGNWLPEPPVGRVANGIPGELDFLGGLDDEVSNGKKTDAEANQLRWAFLRAMWEHREAAKASQDSYIRGLRDSVPDMPYRNAHERWIVGSMLEENQDLRDLWAEFYSKPFQEAQDMQQALLERIRKEKRPKALASRADRLKQLGNSVVPQIPEVIGRMILEIAA